jgi:hypothetical protein
VNQLELFAAPESAKSDDEGRWIRHPGRTCTEETCEFFKAEHYPWGECYDFSYAIVGSPHIGEKGYATFYPGEGPRPAPYGDKERCQTCADFGHCQWWMWVKPCLMYKPSKHQKSIMPSER